MKSVHHFRLISSAVNSTSAYYRIPYAVFHAHIPAFWDGQHQIYLEHVDGLMCSEKTLYNYVDAQLFDIRNIDLPRKVKYRPRYKKVKFR